MMGSSVDSVQLLTREEVASKLRIGLSTLHEWRNEKYASFDPRLPKPIEKGSFVRFLEHELDAYILDLADER